MRFNKNQKPPKKIHRLPKHNEQIVSNGFVLHDTKGWRRMRTTNTVAGRRKIEAFLSKAIRQ